jgi:hypothetical protein
MGQTRYPILDFRWCLNPLKLPKATNLGWYSIVGGMKTLSVMLLVKEFINIYMNLFIWSFFISLA